MGSEKQGWGKNVKERETNGQNRSQSPSTNKIVVLGGDKRTPKSKDTEQEAGEAATLLFR